MPRRQNKPEEPNEMELGQVVSPRLDRQVQARIGEQLRSMYDDLLQQPVPDRLLELLKQLDQTPPAQGDGDTHS